MGIHDLLPSTGIKQSVHYENKSTPQPINLPNTEEASLLSFKEEEAPMGTFLYPGSNCYDDVASAEQKAGSSFFI